MPFDLSVWELSRLLVALLLGIALAAVPAALLLIRARRRESCLRRQVARLTTAQALLNPTRPGSGPRDAGQQGSVPAQQVRGGAEADTDRTVESAWESEPLPPTAVADIPAASGEQEQRVGATGSAQVPIQLDHPDPDPPTQPERGSGQQREAAPQGASSPADPDFDSEDSAERFRRDYTDPMTEHRKRLAELRSQLNGDSADQGTTPVHNN